MNLPPLYYKGGYKYICQADWQGQINLYPPHPIDTQYCKVSTDGDITIAKWYGSDGPSGPSIDTDTFMLGAWVHDALYQLLREEHLPPSFRKDADRVLVEICEAKGMSWFRRQYVYRSLRMFGSPAASPKNIKEVFIA